MGEETGVEMIAKERQRQIEKGYDLEHDREHDKLELVSVASEIIAHLDPTIMHHPGEDWGIIDKQDGKPKEEGELRLLVIAGALIAAEIDRRQVMG